MLHQTTNNLAPLTKASLAVVGATGMVGRKILDILEERHFPMSSLTLLASSRSAGEKILYQGKEITVCELKADSFEGVDLAFFAAGGNISHAFVPKAVTAGAIVIDNSSEYRMVKGVPLIVPEVNGALLHSHQGIIANPNCSTIQAVMALKPLLDTYGIKRIIYATYQAVSGAGLKGVTDLTEKRTDNLETFAYPIYDNCIPQIDVFLENGYTKEEMKMIEETRKIFSLPDLPVTATAVRVPVSNGHSEAITVELEQPFEIEDIKKIMAAFPGLRLRDDIDHMIYPMVRDANGRDDVLVGRIRRDFSVSNGINIFVVADNIRKGAALNAVQIAECLFK